MDFRIVWDSAFEAISNLSDYHLVGRHIRETAEAFEERFEISHLIAQGETDGQHGAVYLDTLGSSPANPAGSASLCVKEISGRDELRAVTEDGDVQVTKGGYILPTFHLVSATDADFSGAGNIPFKESVDVLNAWDNSTYIFTAPNDGLVIFAVSAPGNPAAKVMLYHTIGADTLVGYGLGGFDGLWILYMLSGETVYFRRAESTTIPSGTLLIMQQVYRGA